MSSASHHHHRMHFLAIVLAGLLCILSPNNPSATVNAQPTGTHWKRQEPAPAPAPAPAPPPPPPEQVQVQPLPELPPQQQQVQVQPSPLVQTVVQIQPSPIPPPAEMQVQPSPLPPPEQVQVQPLPQPPPEQPSPPPQVQPPPPPPQQPQPQQPQQERAQIQQKTTCTVATRLQRRAWQDFSDLEKRAYLDAELCLMHDRRAATGAPGAQSRYDDLVAVHQLQASWVHLDGWFLPFHRLYVYTHERMLRDECGYQGAHPYWDETRDAGNFAASTVFSPTLGFGGGSGGCVTDGPFATNTYTLHIGPGYGTSDYCLSRHINEDISSQSSASNVESCLSQPRYADAWPCIEGVPHVGGHLGVGGVMDDAVASPGDPLFFLHHGFIDKVWWQWQQRDLPARLTDIAGFTTSVEPPGGWIPASLEDELNMHGIVPNARIRDLMDISNGFLCYEYV